MVATPSAQASRFLGEQLHTVSSDAAYALLDSSSRGLSTAQASQRLRQHGRSTIREEHAISLFVKLAANFTHLMALLLWVGGAIGFVAHLPRPRRREFPFDSRRKRMTTIHQLSVISSQSSVNKEFELEAAGSGAPQLKTENSQLPTAFVKGAPKEVLALCTSIH